MSIILSKYTFLDSNPIFSTATVSGETQFLNDVYLNSINIPTTTTETLTLPNNSTNTGNITTSDLIVYGSTTLTGETIINLPQTTTPPTEIETQVLNVGTSTVQGRINATTSTGTGPAISVNGLYPTLLFPLSSIPIASVTFNNNNSTLGIIVSNTFTPTTTITWSVVLNFYQTGSNVAFVEIVSTLTSSVTTTTGNAYYFSNNTVPAPSIVSSAAFGPNIFVGDSLGTLLTSVQLFFNTTPGYISITYGTGSPAFTSAGQTYTSNTIKYSAYNIF